MLDYATFKSIVFGSHDREEVAKLKARLEKARDDLDDAKEEVQKEKDRRVEYRQRNHALNTALQRAHKELEAMRLQKSLQVTAEYSQNLKAYHEAEKAREALQARVTQLELVNTSASAKLVAVVRRAPGHLKQAWLLPHSVIGWYNEFGRAVQALDEETPEQSEDDPGAWSGT